ncbi:uncharacterized protein LOC127288038 [Leptopilina boulardi]|uniref:uncharacterized protein LOC127288038 n=1 Tax=Leptopilina boulardi TaxID=63433 RepID=UPI0021F62AE4|nr:uncharacterized protein LOC127288038 [Leptopilina boulardi]XP_051171200.1 uncharacterized protein LOC127288038 [Leptopilina boulardi]XP_051171201.1 uncharacterized protein LOC127288038 [Leptopilina boulardi]
MTNWIAFRRLFLEKQLYTCQKQLLQLNRLNFSDKNDNDTQKPKRTKEEELEYLQSHSFSSWEEIEVPTTCCMSGCANCVWIQYAEKVSQLLNESDKNFKEIIMEKVQDPNMRAFLEMELRCRDLSKK